MQVRLRMMNGSSWSDLGRSEAGSKLVLCPGVEANSNIPSSHSASGAERTVDRQDTNFAPSCRMGKNWPRSAMTISNGNFGVQQDRWHSHKGLDMGPAKNN
jgi:hypothetical protein